MRYRTVIITVMVAIMLAAPLANATWRGRGFWEPDTLRDVQEGTVWTDPDTSEAGAKVYFTAYSGLYVVTPNANVGATGASIMTYPTSIHAMLGVWKDCNGDGYVGMPEGLFLTYRAELLLDTSVCPPQQVNWVNDPQQLVYNDGTWIREFWPIGPDGDADNNAFNIPDEDALIWGDFGLPETEGTRTCPVEPRPEGTYQSTGGFLRYADCHAAWRITGAVNDVATTTGVDAISFADAPEDRPDQSGSLLNQPNPWGQEEDASYVTVYDCSQPPVAQTVTDPTGGQLSPVFGEDGETTINVTYVPGTPSADPSGSLAGTTNETYEGAASDCDRTNDNGGVTGGQIYELDESEFEGTAAKREQSDVYFGFTEGSNGGCPSTSPLVTPMCPVPDAAGVGVLPNGATATAYWFGAPAYVASRNPYVNRDTLQAWGGVYFTTYAYVNPAAVPAGALKGGGGIYGSAHCNGLAETSGAWECDPAQWWLGPDGEKLESTPPPELQVVPGQEWNLIDVDCYDASVSNMDGLNAVNTGLVGANQCVRP